MACLRRPWCASVRQSDYDPLTNAHTTTWDLLLHASGDLWAARECFTQAVQLNPGYATAHNNLGAVLLAQGQFDEAVAHFQRALLASPDYAEAHFNTGIALQSRGDPAGAAASFREAIRIRPSYARAYFHLGQVLEVCERNYDALASYESRSTPRTSQRRDCSAGSVSCCCRRKTGRPLWAPLRRR